ncbi:MAG: tRNA-dihydrouridine synthase family protein [Gammaproteobacteria bacterium]|nr:tRNA-dihydrouridine synthase family protein [Gammaproteobacteria bacterium]
MIKPLRLGNHEFPINLIQGPLAGYSNAPFRLLTWQHSRPTFTCTEMISSKALIHQPHLSKRYIQKNPGEGPVCFQLSGNDPDELAQAAKMATDAGADLIDLNCGCPVKKIRRKGVGSSLLANPIQLFKLIVALKSNTTVPVSIKIRVAGDSDEKFNAQIAKVVTDAGADFLIVHGRHWTENYDIPCRYDEIKFFVENLKIPVIGNGDISCAVSLQKMFATGCAGVMIARAGVGQPWLIKKLIAEVNQEKFHMPTYPEIGAIFLEHVENLITFCGSERFAIIQARKLVKYYARGLRTKVDLINASNKINSLNELKTLCSLHFVA